MIAEPSHAAGSPVSWSDLQRQARFEHWLAAVAPHHGLALSRLRLASADASFRRYLRIDSVVPGVGSRIIMDAPPEQEDCRPFVTVARMLGAAGLHAPEVLDWQVDSGFMLLSDLGSVTYLDRLDTDLAEASDNKRLMLDALDALVRMQSIAAHNDVPVYDQALLEKELEIFVQWYLLKHCECALSEEQQHRLRQVFARILENNLAQARVFVHRDYHSRNLMVSQPNPGILDFQDAVWGPITYDLVSFLRDAYIEWDEEVQIDYAARYWERAKKAHLPVHADFSDFWRDFEWMGLQRHLKVLGIFARLYHRDGKSGYLKDIPRVWSYAHRVCLRYQGLGPLAQLLESTAGAQRQDGYTF